jgi:hypothetical protein
MFKKKPGFTRACASRKQNYLTPVITVPKVLPTAVPIPVPVGDWIALSYMIFN